MIAGDERLQPKVDESTSCSCQPKKNGRKKKEKNKL
jgi:hypothetical protein